MPVVNALTRSMKTARFGSLRFGTGRWGFVPRDLEQKGLVDPPDFYRHQPATHLHEGDDTHTVVEEA